MSSDRTMSEGDYQAGLVDPPAPESEGPLVGGRPPAGYTPCPTKCGRWKPSANRLCWQCYVAETGRSDEVVETEPDWLPVPEKEVSTEPTTVGDLVKVIRKFGLVTLKSAFMCAQLDEKDGARAEAYKACWVALTPHSNREVVELRRLVEAAGPDLEGAPESLRAKGPYWRYQHFSGNANVPGSQVVFGWTVKLGRHTTAEEKRWFKSRGYAFSGGRWCRSDMQDAVSKEA